MCVRCVYDECTMNVRGFLVENVYCFQETKWLMLESHLRIRSFLLTNLYTCITTFPLSVLILESHLNVNAV